MARWIALAALAALTLTGCGGAAAPAVASVQWADYAPGLQGRIDGLATAKDCAALQKEFDVADKNSEAVKARTGHGNAELMKYLDATLKGAGCYK